MKILCINYEYPPIGGGGASACKGLAETLVQRGDEVDVVTSGMKGLSEYEEVNGVHVHRVNCVRRHKHYATTSELVSQVFPSYKKAIQLIKKKEYDINHTHFVVPSGLVSYLIKRKTGLPYIITAHGSDVAGYNPDRFRLMHSLIEPLWKMIMRNSSAITAPSRFLGGLIQNKIDRPVMVIPNGFDLKGITELKKENRILVVTRMFERKGVQILLEALHGMKTDWEVWIVGDGPYLPVLKELANNLDVQVKFFGQIAYDQIFQFYMTSKIYIFPSAVENFPVVLLEAMAAGCAVITTTAFGCAEVVGNAAIKVEPGNIGTLRDALITLIKNQQEIEKLSRMGQEQVKKFAWPIVAGEFQKLFSTI